MSAVALLSMKAVCNVVALPRACKRPHSRLPLDQATAQPKMYAIHSQKAVCDLNLGCCAPSWCIQNCKSAPTTPDTGLLKIAQKGARLAGLTAGHMPLVHQQQQRMHHVQSANQAACGQIISTLRTLVVNIVAVHTRPLACSSRSIAAWKVEMPTLIFSGRIAGAASLPSC